MHKINSDYFATPQCAMPAGKLAYAELARRIAQRHSRFCLLKERHNQIMYRSLMVVCNYVKVERKACCAGNKSAAQRVCLALKVNTLLIHIFVIFSNLTPLQWNQINCSTIKGWKNPTFCEI